MNQYRQYRPAGNFPEPVAHLLILNIIVFAFQNMFPQYQGLVVGHYLFSPNFKAWQIISHMFAHADTMHLFFNMFNLWMFGRILAGVWDTKRFFFFYFTCGFVAFLAHQIYLFTILGPNPVDSVMLGASGAVYGVLVAFATLFPNTELYLFFIPLPIKAKYLIGALIVYDLFFGIMGQATGVAHFAHLGGAISGFLLVRYWQKNNKSFY